MPCLDWLSTPRYCARGYSELVVAPVNAVVAKQHQVLLWLSTRDSALCQVGRAPHLFTRSTRQRRSPGGLTGLALEDSSSRGCRPGREPAPGQKAGRAQVGPWPDPGWELVRIPHVAKPPAEVHPRTPATECERPFVTLQASCSVSSAGGRKFVRSQPHMGIGASPRGPMLESLLLVVASRGKVRLRPRQLCPHPRGLTHGPRLETRKGGRCTRVRRGSGSLANTCPPPPGTGRPR